MKNIKNIFLSISSVVTVATSFAMQVTPTFEIYNKDKQAIIVTLNQKKYTVDPGKNLQLAMSTIKPISFDIEYSPGVYSIQTETEKYIIKAQGSTIYLTFDSSHKPTLYPQTGPLMGLLSKTKSGLSLNNNVNPSEIQYR